MPLASAKRVTLRGYLSRLDLFQPIRAHRRNVDARRRVTLSVGRNRGSTRKLTPTLSFDSSTLPPIVAMSDSPMRLKATDWPMLPLSPKSIDALAEPIHLALMR